MVAASVMAPALVIFALQWNGRGLAPRRASPKTSAASIAKPPGVAIAQNEAVNSIGPTGKSARRDPAVALAAAVEPADSTRVNDLVLSGDDDWHLDAQAIKAGQRVRWPAGVRPRVSVPRGGLVVGCDDVCFESIDFVYQASDTGAGAIDRVAAMIVVAGQGVELRGCSLASVGDAPPAAICWKGTSERTPGSSGEMTLRDCVASGVAAVVDCSSTGGLSVRLSNTLCVAAGPIVRLHGPAASDQRLTISLEHVTTRGDGAVLEWRYGRTEKAPRPIEISATACALDTNPEGGLLIFVGTERPDRWLRAITWSGEGSLVTPQAAMALWHGPGDKREVLPDDALEIAGLVRSRVEFAGGAQGPPSASRLIRWQAPLRSPEAPGIDSNSLYLPRN